MNRLIAALLTGLHERDAAVRLGLLASMAGESMFLLGPPGVGKSLVARRLQMVFADASSFSYLMGRFSTPDEVFGPLSIQRLREDDRYERVTANYLPEADVVFLDEIWKASAPIRNALLTALNERLYRNGSREIELPLKVFIGASNELPQDDETAAAFWDRFLIRLVLEPIANDDAFLSLVNDTRDIYEDVVPDDEKVSSKEYAEIQVAVAQVQVPEAVGALLLDVRDRIQSADGVLDSFVSDRRWKKIVHLLRASALLHGRGEVSALDCAIIRHCVWNKEEDRHHADQVVRDALAAHAAGPAMIREFSKRIQALEEQLLACSVETAEDEVTSPTMYREEYYRLLTPAGFAADGAIRTLVWHGDIDDLSSDEYSEIDVFSYDEGDQLIESQQVHARRSAPWHIDVDNAEWEIETVKGVGTTTRSRQLTAAEREELIAQVTSLTDEIVRATERVASERDATEDYARAHLFVSREYVKIVTEAMDRATEELVKVRIESEQLRKQIDETP